MSSQLVQTIRGYVQALPRLEQTAREDAPRVAVVAEDGTEYHVWHKGNGTALVADINADVEVRGYVGGAVDESSDDADKAVFFTVKSYRNTDGFDDPWYDDGR